MPCDGGALGSSPPLHRMRARRLLRQLAEQARDCTLPREVAPDRAVVRTRRRLVLLLRGRRGVRTRRRRPEPVTSLRCDEPGPPRGFDRYFTVNGYTMPSTTCACLSGPGR